MESFDTEQLESASVRTSVAEGGAVTANLILFGGTGTVEGQVLDGAGNPAVGVTIGGGPQIAISDSNGRFTLFDMPLGTHDLQAMIPETQILTKGTVKLVRPGETVGAILRLPAVGRITGSIRRADGSTPVSDLEIVLTGPKLYFSRTDANGRYLVENVVAGQYLISAYTSDFSDGNARSVRLVAHHQTVNGDVNFRGKGRLQVTVLDDDGITPLAGQIGLTELLILQSKLTANDNPRCLADIKVGDYVIHFTPCRTIGVGFYTSVNNRIVNNNPSTGVYLFEDVFVGPVSLEAVNAFNGRTGSNGSVRLGETTYITLTLKATSVLTGTVYQPDGVTPVGEDILVSFDSRTMRDVRVVTDEQGHFAFPLVSAGGFSLVANDEGTGLTGQTLGSVRAGDLATVDVRLLGEGTVHVQVLGKSGAALVNAPLSLREGNFTKQQQSGITDGNGRFTFTGVREGKLSVHADDPVGGGSGFGGGTLPAPGAQITITVTVPDEFGTVTGHFLRAADDTPIAGAQIHLRSSFDGRDAYEISDASGLFTFTGVPKAGFAVDAVDFVNGSEGFASGSITAHGQTVNVIMRERPQGEVRGFVVESLGGAAIPAATVSLKSNDSRTMVTSSGADGSFGFPGVNAGNFTINASDPATGWSGTAKGTLQHENQIVTQTVTLNVPLRGSVEGIVRHADGSPASTVQVLLRVSGEKNNRATTPDANGYYRFDNLPLTSFSVSALAQVGSDAGRATGSLIFHTEVVSVPVQLLGTGTISGVVVDGAGNPVPFVPVKLQRKGSLPRGFLADMLADGNGRFRFEQLLIGDFSVSAKNPANGLGGADTTTLAAAGDTAQITLTLQAAGSIRGRVLRADGVTPAENISLALTGSRAAYGVSEASGVFTFTELPLGSYALAAEDPLGIGVAAANGTLTAQDEIVDLGDLILDESVPSVVSIDPADGASDVAVDSAITVRFSEPVLAGNLGCGNATNAKIVVSEVGSVIAGACVLMDGDTAVRFTPNRAFKDFSPISVRVHAGIADRAGQLSVGEQTVSFTTRDITPPALTTASPTAGALNVSLEAVIRVQYSEPVDPAAFNGAAIAVTRNGVAVPGRVDLINGNTVIVFTPNAPWQPNAVYAVAVQPAADRKGNYQASGLSFSFTALDIVPPAVTGLTLASGGPTVIEGQSLLVTAAVDTPADVVRVDFFLNGAPVRSDDSAPFQYLFAIPTGAGPGLTVSARATDRAGNVSPDKQLALTVQRDMPPLLTLLRPADGGTVEAGGQVVIEVRGEDDLGISRTFFQSAGGIASTSSATLPTPQTVHVRTYTLTVPADLPLGSTINLQTSAADTANQTSNLLRATLHVTGSELAIRAPLSGTQVIPGTSVAVTVSVTDVDGVARVDLLASGAATWDEQKALTPAQTDIVQVFNLPIPANAPAGQTVVLSARAVDGKGNLSPLRTLRLLIRDVTPPAVTVSAPAGVTVIEGRPITLSVSAGDDLTLAHLGFRTEGALSRATVTGITPLAASAQRWFSFTPPLGITGLITATGVATDTTGNVGTSSPLRLSVLPDLPPRVRYAAPTDGTRDRPWRAHHRYVCHHRRIGHYGLCAGNERRAERDPQCYPFLLATNHSATGL